MHRARADPVRGRPRRGLGRDPARAAPGARARGARHAHHGRRRRARRLLAVRVLDARGPAARLDHRVHGRRGGVLAAARRRACAGGSSARWRARPASTTRSPSCSCSASSSGSSTPTTACRTWRCCSSSSSGIGLVAGLAVGALAVQAFRRVRLIDARASIRSRRSRRRRSPSALADTLHGSGFLAVYLCGLALGSADLPARAHRRPPSTRGWRGSAQLAMFLTLGLLVFPRRARRRRWSRARCSPLIVVFVARPLATAIATIGSGLRRGASWRCSAGPACAARCPSCSPSSR